MVNGICTVVVLIPLHKPLADRPVGTPILMPFVLLSTLFFLFYFISDPSPPTLLVRHAARSIYLT